MQGVQVSQARAHELSGSCEAFLSPSTGFWLRTDNVDRELYTYHVYVTGNVIQEIPEDAFRFHFEITLTEAASLYDIPYSTMAAWAREGKLDARKSAGIWLTTHQALEDEIVITDDPPKEKRPATLLRWSTQREKDEAAEWAERLCMSLNEHIINAVVEWNRHYCEQATE